MGIMTTLNSIMVGTGGAGNLYENMQGHVER